MTRVQTKGSLMDGSLRFRAVCSCGWATGSFLSAMQAHHAAEDHVCRQARPEADPSGKGRYLAQGSDEDQH